MSNRGAQARSKENYAMAVAVLKLPYRPQKPRSTGLTILIDNGLPTHYFADVVASASHYIDFVKFGWGTALVTEHLDRKMETLRAHQVDYFFGGTLFEKYFSQGKVDAYYALCMANGCRVVEISNGTVELSDAEKTRFVRDFAREFTVLSEVGYKDSERSQNLHPARWIEYLRADLESGARYVLTESRESGTSGICRPDGTLRFGLIEEILASDLDPNRIVFEAPNKTLQTYFIKRLGSNVNLANISFADPIALETLRLGLRADTLLAVGE
jgi:phosphosulfolactate synthase